MIVAMSLLSGILGGALVWSALAGPMSNVNDRLSRENFRGNMVPFVGGVAIVLVAAIGSVVLLVAVSVDELAAEASFGAFQLAVGFGVLGLLDDVAGQPGGGGFSGHLRALRSKKVSTGIIKLVGGVLVALIVAGLVTPNFEASGWLRDAALIAGGANLANLFDRAPGRTVKVSVLAFTGMIIAVGFVATLSFAALAVGGGLGLAWWELREKVMLGDTGVNVIGALVGLSAVTSLGSTALWAWLGVVVILNLVSEFISFSKVIERIWVLRVVDRFARPAP